MLKQWHYQLIHCTHILFSIESEESYESEESESEESYVDISVELNMMGSSIAIWLELFFSLQLQ